MEEHDQFVIASHPSEGMAIPVKSRSPRRFAPRDDMIGLYS